MRGTRSSLNALLAVGGLITVFWVPASRADGDPTPTYQRERSAQRFKDCHWTDEMGKYLYQCIKKNDGMNAHWCYDEALEVLCPAQSDAGEKSAAETNPAPKPGN